MKISVIVPIYNTEKYLSKCIESLINQDHDNLEIILVNDGSKDNSQKICEEYAEKDSRIVLINKENGGLSSARNHGLKLATGDYVAFVDSDDWIELDMYSSMLKHIIETNAELCFCAYFKDNVNNSIVCGLSENKETLDFHSIRENVIPRMIAPYNLGSKERILPMVWRVLYNRKFLESNNLYFSTDMPYAEDDIFIIDALFNCSNISLLNKPFYHYVFREGSAVNKYRPKYRKEKNLYFNNLIEILKTYSSVDSDFVIKYKRNLNNQFICINEGDIINECHTDNKKKISDKLKYIKNICDDEKLQHLLKNLNVDFLSKRLFIMYWLIKHKQICLLYVYCKYFKNLNLIGIRKLIGKK